MKYTLLEEYDYDFTLIGISCHAKDYRICWSINQRFGYDFEKQEHDLEMLNGKYKMKNDINGNSLETTQ